MIEPSTLLTEMLQKHLLKLLGPINLRQVASGIDYG